MRKTYIIDVTRPGGEKLEPIKVDPEAFMIARADDVG